MSTYDRFPGSRWWKFDFHTHTPASNDYPRNGTAPGSPEDWLLPYMRQGFDAVVVTDHNSGDWVDRLKAARDALRNQPHPEFRELAILPGAELAANGSGAHVLIVLDPARGSADVAEVLGACGYTGARGDPAARCSKSMEEILAACTAHGGVLAVPAHVDDADCGLWHTDAMSLDRLLERKELIAWEVRDAGAAVPQLVAQKRRAPLTAVLGSDSHCIGSAGAAFTWVKMSRPTLEGLRLALLDGDLCIRRGDQCPGDPNTTRAGQWITAVEVEQAQFMGRPTPFRVEFNPWMSALIGGRGTGKSTMLEFMRIALRRERELEPFDDIKAEFDAKYGAEWAGRDKGGLQTAQTAIRVQYWKDERHYRLSYDREGALPSLEEARSDNSWQGAAGEIAGRFPVRIFSQKQIYEMAGTPSALLGLIDQDPRVGKAAWETRRRDLENSFKTVSARIREIAATLDEESRLQGELEDANQKLALLSREANQQILTRYHQATAKIAYLRGWGAGLAEQPEQLDALAAGLQVPALDKARLDATEDAAVLAAAEALATTVANVASTVAQAGLELAQALRTWEEFLQTSPWAKQVEQATVAYDKLVAELKAKGVQDPREFATRLQQKQDIDKRLSVIASRREELKRLAQQRQQLLGQIQEHRRALTAQRRDFLAGVLRGNAFIQIQVVPYGDHEDAENGYRSAIRRGQGLEEHILSFPRGTGVLKSLYTAEFEPVADLAQVLGELKESTHKVARGDRSVMTDVGKWFANHLQKEMRPEDHDTLDLWFPEDTLQVRYRARDGGPFEPITRGSPGQKTAALLAFLLAYGDDPLVLDQPEDDLDNRLIYSMLTRQLDVNKRRRQIIVVTHNANIVVNGDAELVVALEAERGQTVKAAEGGLQEESVRRTICDVMEGGERAFELRYRRMKEDLTHV